MYLGFGIGILLTLVVYLVLRADPAAGPAIPIAWASPVAIDALLAALPDQISFHDLRHIGLFTIEGVVGV